MRIKLSLKAKTGNLISFNYQYHLSSAIYNLLRLGSEEFSEFLHDRGYLLNGKSYKLFTFALRFQKYTTLQNAIRLDQPDAYLIICSPLIDDFVKNFIIGTFEKQTIDLSELNFPVSFRINFAEIIPEPVMKDEMSFKLLSPLVISTIRYFEGKTSQYYLRPENISDIDRILSKNLQNKFKTIYNRDIKENVQLYWDEVYMSKNKRITKKITINQHGKNPVDIIGMQAPFRLKGHPELLKVGYECGFGEKNSMGFGMAEVIKN